jgi:transcriptional regulator with XRE-family HTH domain
MLSNLGYIDKQEPYASHRTCVTIVGNIRSMKTKPTRQIVADNIRRLMETSDPSRNTQLGLSRKAGVAQSSIGRLIRGEVEARLDLLDDVARALGVTVGELTTDRDSSYVEYDRKQYSALPKADKEKVEAFISFVIDGHLKRGHRPALEFSQISEPTDSEKLDVAAVGPERLNQQTTESNERDQVIPRKHKKNR